LPEPRRSYVEAGLNDDQDADRLIRYATVGVGVFGAYIPLIGLYLAATAPIEPGHVLQILVLYAIVAPPGLWLLLAAARNERPRGRWWVLAAIAVVIIGALPVVQADWIRGLYVLTAVVLVVVPRPWSLALGAGLAAAPAPLAVWFGHATGWAGYFTLGLLIHAVPLAVLVWLAAKAHEVRDARQALAREAVIRERLRIDDELRATLGAALETIAARASRAGGLTGDDPAAAASEVSAVTDNARGTLAEARRMVTRYQTVSLRAELAAAAALLSAAGIRTRVELPGEVELLSEPLRSALRAGTARLLSTDAVRECVIAVHHRSGRAELDMSGDGIPVTPC